jgi:hypothetical protein
MPHLPTRRMRMIRVPIALAVLAACGGGIAGLGDGRGTAGLRIVSGATSSDTISSLVAQPLEVEVVDASGRPAVGRPVVFLALSAPPTPASILYTQLLIARGGRGAFEVLIVDTTDSRGRAAVQVRHGNVTGAGAVRITVPDLGYADSARYTTLVGAVDHVDVAPADSAAYVGRGYVVRAQAADRGGNPRPNDPISFSIAEGPATIDATTGALVATAIGRARILARSGTKWGTAFLSVVPRGWVAAQQHGLNGTPLGIFLMELDGSGRTPLAGPLEHALVSGQGFGWSPDGRDLAIARGDSIDLVSPGSPERRLVRASGAVLLGARFSRDGQWIYFSQARDGLSRIRPDGTGLELIGVGAGQFGQDFRPSPSPDGGSIAYASSRTPCGIDNCIRVLDLATRTERIYGGRDYLARGTNVAWSPTGDLIAYATATLVAVIRSDGTNMRTLAGNLGGVSWLDWSPDGRWLVVSAGAGPPLLFDVATGEQMPVSSLAGYGATAWRS